MIDIGTVYGSKEQAKPLIVNVDTVYVHTDIKETTDEYGNEMYQYHEIQYGKDEYIELISKTADTTEAQALYTALMTDTLIEEE